MISFYSTAVKDNYQLFYYVYAGAQNTDCRNIYKFELDDEDCLML